MEEKTRYMIFSGMAFVAGLALGVGMGILIAPQSGDRTRRHLQNMMLDAQEDAENFLKDAKETVSDVVSRGKKVVSKS